MFTSFLCYFLCAFVHNIIGRGSVVFFLSVAVFFFGRDFVQQTGEKYFHWCSTKAMLDGWQRKECDRNWIRWKTFDQQLRGQIHFDWGEGKRRRLRQIIVAGFPVCVFIPTRQILDHYTDHLSSVRRSTLAFMLYLVEHTICFCLCFFFLLHPIHRWGNNRY